MACTRCESTGMLGFYDQANPLRPRRMVVGLSGSIRCPTCIGPDATERDARAIASQNRDAARAAGCRGY